MPRYYILDNRSYTIKQLAQMSGFSYDTMRMRLKKMSPEEAITLPKNNTTPFYIVGDMVIEREEMQKAKALGLSRYTIYSRIADYGWDKDRALTTPPMTKSEVGKIKRG